MFFSLDVRRGRVFRSIERRHVLPGQHDGLGALGLTQCSPPGINRLIGVARAKHDQARNRSRGGEMLDRLVRRAVLAAADRVVSLDPVHADRVGRVDEAAREIRDELLHVNARR